MIVDCLLEKGVKETMQSTVDSDPSADHFFTLKLAFVGPVIIAETVEQISSVLELMLVVHCNIGKVRQLLILSLSLSLALSLSLLPSLSPSLSLSNPPSISLLLTMVHQSTIYESLSEDDSFVSILSFLLADEPVDHVLPTETVLVRS